MKAEWVAKAMEIFFETRLRLSSLNLSFVSN